MSQLEEWRLWVILTEAKGLRTIHACIGQGCGIILDVFSQRGVAMTRLRMEHPATAWSASLAETVVDEEALPVDRHPGDGDCQV